MAGLGSCYGQKTSLLSFFNGLWLGPVSRIAPKTKRRWVGSPLTCSMSPGRAWLLGGWLAGVRCSLCSSCRRPS